VCNHHQIDRLEDQGDHNGLGSDKRKVRKKSLRCASRFQEKPLVFVSGLSKRIPEFNSSLHRMNPGNQGRRTKEIRSTKSLLELALNQKEQEMPLLELS